MGEFMEMKKRDNEVSEIIVKFDDGTERAIQKGAVIERAGQELNILFAHMSGKEVVEFFTNMLMASAEVLGIEENSI